MLLEKLFLSFRLVEKQISRPVSRRQSSKSFLQVVMFLETLDELLQFLLSSLNWSKSAETHGWSQKKPTQILKSFKHFAYKSNSSLCHRKSFKTTNSAGIDLLTWCSFCVFENPGMGPGWGSWSNHHSHIIPSQSFPRRAHSASLPPDWLH